MTPTPMIVTSAKSLPPMKGTKSPPLVALSQSPGTFMKSVWLVEASNVAPASSNTVVLVRRVSGLLR